MRNRRNKFGDPTARLEWARSEMERVFPGANFAPDDRILTTLRLPDPGDVHVVATAVAAEASTIITYNERDFPWEALKPYGVRAEPPDFFCIRLENSPLLCERARLHRASLKNPPYDLNAYLEHLERQGLEQTATILRASPYPI